MLFCIVSLHKDFSWFISSEVSSRSQVKNETPCFLPWIQLVIQLFQINISMPIRSVAKGSSPPIALVFGPETPTVKVPCLFLILFLIHICLLVFAVGVSAPNTRPRLLENVQKFYVWLPLLREERSEATRSQWPLYWTVKWKELLIHS